MANGDDDEENVDDDDHDDDHDDDDDDVDDDDVDDDDDDVDVVVVDDDDDDGEYDDDDDGDDDDGDDDDDAGGDHDVDNPKENNGPPRQPHGLVGGAGTKCQRVRARRCYELPNASPQVAPHQIQHFHSLSQAVLSLWGVKHGCRPAARRQAPSWVAVVFGRRKTHLRLQIFICKPSTVPKPPDASYGEY